MGWRTALLGERQECQAARLGAVAARLVLRFRVQQSVDPEIPARHPIIWRSLRFQALLDVLQRLVDEVYLPRIAPKKGTKVAK
jgi:hypothetical protein